MNCIILVIPLELNLLKLHLKMALHNIKMNDKIYTNNLNF